MKISYIFLCILGFTYSQCQAQRHSQDTVINANNPSYETQRYVAAFDNISDSISLNSSLIINSKLYLPFSYLKIIKNYPGEIINMTLSDTASNITSIHPLPQTKNIIAFTVSDKLYEILGKLIIK